MVESNTRTSMNHDHRSVGCVVEKTVSAAVVSRRTTLREAKGDSGAR